MIVKENSLYVPIFPDLVEFLINNSTFEVYFIGLNSKPEQTLIGQENLYHYINKYNKSVESRIAGGMFFQKFDLPTLRIDVTSEGYLLNSYYNSYRELNFEKK